MLTSFDGGRMFGQVHGTGSPRVVALHGWRRDHRDFAGVLGDSRTLPSTGEVASPGSVPSVALDLPGFGASPPPEEAWGSVEYAEAVARVLAGLGGPVVVVGHSFGGRVATELAAGYPEYLAGLLLTGAPLFAASSLGSSRPSAPLGYRLIRGLQRRGLVSHSHLERAREHYGSADYRAASGVMRGVLVRAIGEERAAAYTDALGAITCPVELLWGRNDTAAPVDVAERIAASLVAPTRMTVLEGVGHLTPLEAPGELRAAIERLLGSGT